MADRIPTFGDLCSAIAEGQIAATVDGTMYKMNAFEVRRYLNKLRTLPTISSAHDQSSSAHPKSDSTSASQISVA